MNNFKMILAAFVVILLVCSGLAMGLDWLHPRLPCMAWEVDYGRRHPDVYNFERVSSFFWSALCAPQPRPILISASEGTGKTSFGQVAARWGITAHEFKGAHRGLKTLAYMLASAPHEERWRNLRMIAMVNPVYFSFAASTDSSSLRLTALSNFSYLSRIPSVRQKWDEFFLDSFYISARAYVEDLALFFLPHRHSVIRRNLWISPPLRFSYDFKRNMLSAKAEEFTAFRSPFSSNRQPARFLFDQVTRFASAHPTARICYVLLPTNVRNLRYFGREADQITRDLSGLWEHLPEASRLDLQYLNEEPYLFLDPMHLTDFGKRRVMEEVMNSACASRALGDFDP